MTETVARRWISYAEASEISGLGRTSLWKLVEAGHVPAARVGRRVLIDREGLDAYLENLAREGERGM
ncbi:MAG: DUF6462 family protein [Chloroflexota bacterium]|nr:DUF6462 family protein [Chloroflexota bacterium]